MSEQVDKACDLARRLAALANDDEGRGMMSWMLCFGSLVNELRDICARPKYPDAVADKMLAACKQFIRAASFESFGPNDHEMNKALRMAIDAVETTLRA